MKSLLGLLRNHAHPDTEKPLREVLLSAEQLEERARALAARFIIDPRPGRAARNVLPRLEDNARALRAAYVTLADDVHRGEFVSSAAEWLLDNYHLVVSEIIGVQRNLPPGYYRELPKLALRELAGDARVYAIAVELIRHSDSRLDRPQLVRFVLRDRGDQPGRGLLRHRLGAAGWREGGCWGHSLGGRWRPARVAAGAWSAVAGGKGGGSG